MVLFVLKKAVSRLFFPLPLGLLAAVLGIGLLWGRKQRLGRVLVSLAFAWLLLCSSEVVGSALVRPFESRYEPFGPQQQATMVGPAGIDDIVVLAGCVPSFAEYPITRQVGGSSLERLVEGLRIYRLYPSARVILSGGLGCDPAAPLEKLTNVRFMVEMGVALETVMVERESKDTDDQVRLLAPLLAGRRFVVVTSASHMPRTMALFERVGLRPIPAPTDFHTGLYGAFHRESFSAESVYPNAASLEKSEIAFYEILGMWWTRLTGGL